VVPIVISTLSLLVSVATMWLTLFRRGAVKMTQPTVIYFGPDGGSSPHPKVFLRSLLFCTSRRGRIIESMHIALSRNETHQNFSVWVYGNDKLVRGGVGGCVLRKGSSSTASPARGGCLGRLRRTLCRQRQGGGKQEQYLGATGSLHGIPSLEYCVVGVAGLAGVTEREKVLGAGRTRGLPPPAQNSKRAENAMTRAGSVVLNTPAVRLV
jgi:hypothetical protein